jgi:poly-gamma-glutamate synthesis protein (capsule biosynthesis protein)
MLGRSVGETLASTPGADVWSPGVREVCADCDVLVVNLECCISGQGSPTALIPEKPFYFRAPPSAVEALQAIGASVAGVANNHALDFGADALADTLGHLRAAGIVPVGAGIEIDGARRGVVVQAGRSRLGVLAFSDHPPEYAAGEGRAGIAYADLSRGLPDWVTTELRRLRAQAELVLVFPHWGPNMTSRPARWQRERGRQLLAAGADAVAGHSAHVFHGVALTPSGPVLYDLGGALDDYSIDGVLARWRPHAKPVVELIGLRLGFCRTELAAGADAEWIAARLERACGELGTSVERVDEARFELVSRQAGRSSPPGRSRCASGPPRRGS